MLFHQIFLNLHQIFLIYCVNFTKKNPKVFLIIKKKLKERLLTLLYFLKFYLSIFIYFKINIDGFFQETPREILKSAKQISFDSCLILPNVIWVFCFSRNQNSRDYN